MISSSTLAFALSAVACADAVDGGTPNAGSDAPAGSSDSGDSDAGEEGAMPDASNDGAGGTPSDVGTDGTDGQYGDGGIDGFTNDAPTCRPAGTLGVFTSGDAAYRIEGLHNPLLTLCRGVTYTFALSVSGHPFSIQTDGGIDYDTGVTGNGQSAGDLVFVVPPNAPDRLRYSCAIHPKMTGLIFIVN